MLIVVAGAFQPIEGGSRIGLRLSADELLFGFKCSVLIYGSKHRCIILTLLGYGFLADLYIPHKYG